MLALGEAILDGEILAFDPLKLGETLAESLDEMLRRSGGRAREVTHPADFRRRLGVAGSKEQEERHGGSEREAGDACPCLSLTHSAGSRPSIARTWRPVAMPRASALRPHRTGSGWHRSPRRGQTPGWRRPPAPARRVAGLSSRSPRRARSRPS